VRSEEEPQTEAVPGLLHRIMSSMERLMPPNDRGEYASAVKIFAQVDSVINTIRIGPRRFWQRLRGGQAWPVTSGAYTIGDPTGPVAICTLTTTGLAMRLAELPGVAIAGQVHTVNLGIEKIIINVTANPSIRFLVLCGKESPVFHPAQALRALIVNGVTSERRIIGAVGHMPVLSNLSPIRIAAFRRQVELIDHTEQTDTGLLTDAVESLVGRNPGRFQEQAAEARFGWTDIVGAEKGESRGFAKIRPGGRRQGLAYDPKGFFVISVDRSAGEIVLRHYLCDNTPANEMRGRSGEAMLLGLLREDLVSQMSHAGYIGSELAKAEASLRLSVHYEQDQPLRQESTGGQEGTSR
jgi:tetrahydromethanopterin S-methyltransferase subunit A